jgi:hypothetical protein
MRIKYIDKNSNSIWDVLKEILEIVFFPIILPLVLLWELWTIEKISLESIFKYKNITMGFPYEWGSMSKDCKRDWAFRKWMRFTYFLGCLSLFSLFVVILIAINGKPADTTPLVIFLIIGIISVLSIVGIYYKRKKSLKENFITVSETDYELIKESWTRLHNIEPLSYETEIIKISETEELIYPKNPKVETIKEIEKENTEEPKKEIIIEEKPAKYFNKNKATKLKSTKKNNVTKHIIITKKHKNKNIY